MNLKPALAVKALETWFECTRFHSPDPYAALGAFEEKYLWMPRHPRFLAYKITRPTCGEKFFTSTAHSFLIKGVCLREKGKKPGEKTFAGKVFTAKPQEPLGLPFHASGEPPGEPIAIVCLFRGGAFLDAFAKWKNKEHSRTALEAVRVVERDFLRRDGGIAFSRRNAFTPFNVAAEGASVFAQANALGFGKNYGLLARRCFEFVQAHASGCFWRYSNASKQFDVVHNAMIYASLARARRFLGLKPSAGLAERFNEFCELAAPKQKNLWDYAKLLEAQQVYGMKAQALWREAAGLFDEREGAFRFSFANGVGTGEPDGFYGRHNALMYYSACLLNGRSD